MIRGPRLYLAAAGAAIGVILVWFVFLWGPQTSRLEEAREQRERAEQDVAQLQVRLDRLRASDDRRTELLASLDRIRVAIPAQPNLAQFILDANDVANQSGIDFISISPSPPAAPPAGAPAGSPSVIGLNISISGGYFQVLDYLNRILALPRIVVVDAINVSPQVDGPVVDLSVSLTARMFTSAEPGTIEGGPAPVDGTGSTEGPTDGTDATDGSGEPGGES